MAQTRQNMGSGNVKKLLLQLMIPAVVAQVVNLLYNIVDRKKKPIMILLMGTTSWTVFISAILRALARRR